MGDGDIFKGDIEFLGALEEVGADSVADGFTLGDEFCGVELGNNGFQYFVTNGGKNSFVVVLAEILTWVSSTALLNIQHVELRQAYLVNLR